MSNRGRGRGRKQGGLICFNCGKPGHRKSECYSTPSSVETRNSASIPKFVDTHCHVEYLLEKFRTSSFDVIAKKIKAMSPSFEACISNFCDPVRFLLSLLQIIC